MYLNMFDTFRVARVLLCNGILSVEVARGRGFGVASLGWESSSWMLRLSVYCPLKFSQLMLMIALQDIDWN